MRDELLQRAGVVFDLDGTLVDSAPGIARALNATRLAPRPVDVETVRSLVSFGAEKLVQDALGVPDAEVATALSEFRAHYAEAPCEPGDLFEGVAAALLTFRTSGIAIGVCTNKPQGLADIVMERLGLAGLVDAVVGSTPSWPSKPDPRPLRETIKRMSNEGPIVFVGDSVVDAKTAEAAGVPFVFATFGYGDLDAGIARAGVFHRFADLPGIIAGIFSTEPSPVT
jgi:phosphoglycolate phosphatase